MLLLHHVTTVVDMLMSPWVMVVYNHSSCKRSVKIWFYL